MEERVALAEIAPSLLEAAGVPTPATMQAHSLFPLMNGTKTEIKANVNAVKSEDNEKEKSPERSIYSETNYAHRAFGWSELRSWRTGKYLYVEAPKRELYDQSSDPDAAKNLAPAAKAVADTLESQLTNFQQKTSSAATAPTKMDPTQAEKLRALGYLASDSVGSNSDEKSAVDPKDKIEIANKFHRSLVDMEEDHYEEAATEMREVVRLQPDLASGHLELGRALVHLRQYQEALPVLRIAAEKNPKSGMAHYELGLALIKTGQWEASLPEMQAAVVCTPNSAQLHFYLGAVHLRLKHIPEATAEFENSLKIDPDHFLTNLKYGELLFREGQAEAALPKLTRAAKADPESAEAHAFLADAYQQLGQAQNANRERAKAVQLKSQAPAPE